MDAGRARCASGFGRHQLWYRAGGSPTNPGYMRAFKGRNSQFIIFDADTYEIYRGVEFRSTPPLDSHRLEIGPNGRIWVGYAESGGDSLFAFMLRDQRRGILGLIDNWTKPECGGRAETEYQEVQ